jgi:hypothetical protein
MLVDESEITGGYLDEHTKAVQQGKIVLIARLQKMALFKSTEPKPAPAASAAPSAVAPPPPALPPAPSAAPPPTSAPGRAPTAPRPALPALPHL